MPLFNVFYCSQECDWSGHVLGCDTDVMRLLGSWIRYSDQKTPTERNGAQCELFRVLGLCAFFLVQLARHSVIYNLCETFQLFRSNMSTAK